MELNRLLLVFTLCLISRTLAFETKKLSQPLQKDILTLKSEEPVRIPSETRIRQADEEEGEYDTQCGDLPVVHCGHYTGTSHAMGQTWKLQCDPGCRLVGSGDITCLAVPDPFHHVAIWDHMQGMSKCEKFTVDSKRSPSHLMSSEVERKTTDIQCGDLPVVHCGHYTGTSHAMGQTWKLQCDPGCYLVGSGDITCLAVPDPFHHVAIWDHTQGVSKCEQFTGDAKRSQPYLMDTGVEQKSTDLEAEDDICLQPKNTGPCKARMKRFYFNSVKKICEEFIYGGCKKNDNNFKSLEECKNKCIGN
ncbi:uncharacterized protein LOC125678592 isoform X9 [Ostrea edulis]|uniref:uncharacterized protein LOC125678592 isoform X9 n=1 Tax=Ostrea edulis TaxID=37623 RepID=UPI0024AFE943|nr:uncharacterized protein LOC125678592 isoform X9 [Ostrea edulis]